MRGERVEGSVVNVLIFMGVFGFVHPYKHSV